MDVEVVRDGSVDVVSIRSELTLDDEAQASLLVDAVLGSEATAVVLDLSDLTFIDSAGISQVIKLSRGLAETARRFVIVTGANRYAVKKVDEMGVLRGSVEAFETVDDAMRAL